MKAWLKSHPLGIKATAFLILTASLTGHTLEGSAHKNPGGSKPSLRSTVDQLYADPRCSKFMTTSTGPALPIPMESPPSTYRVYLYSAIQRTSCSILGFATVSAELFEVTSCQEFSQHKRIPGRTVPPIAVKLEDEFNRRVEELIDLTEEIGNAYFEKSTGPETHRLARKYLGEFELLSEPALRNLFLDANPKFWKWVEEQAGRKLSP